MRKKDEHATDAQDFTGMPAASASVTAADIQSKEFNVSRFGGYRMRDVDEFLDQITESMTKLADENRAVAVGERAAGRAVDRRAGPGGHVAPGRRDHRERARRGREDRAGRAGAGRGRDRSRRRRPATRRRRGRRRAVPLAGAGLPAAARPRSCRRTPNPSRGWRRPAGRSRPPRHRRRRTPGTPSRRRSRDPARPRARVDAADAASRAAVATAGRRRAGSADRADPRGGAGDGVVSAGDADDDGGQGEGGDRSLRELFWGEE